MSHFLFEVAHHIPVLDHYVPIAPHISAEFGFRAKPRPRRPRFWS